MKKQGIIEIFWICMMCILIALSCSLVLFLAKEKPGKMLDEYFSFGLANSTYETNHGRYCIYLPQGVAIEPKPFFDQYFFASSFSIQDVWKNQSYDVHPPLYYLIIHTLGRVTRNHFGFQIGIYFNVFLHAINILIVYVLMKLLTEENKWAYFGAFWYGFIPIVLQHAIYIRMYYLLSTLFLVLILWMVIGCIYSDFRKKHLLLFYLGLGAQSICGILTHYYYVFFLFGVCLCWLLFRVVRKEWREVFIFIGLMILAGGLSFCIFPSMMQHVLHGNRGQETIDSLFHSNYLSFLKVYGESIAELCGKWLFPLGIIIFVLVLVTSFEMNKLNKYCLNESFGIVLFPSVCYYLIISKFGVMRSSRFISPVFGVTIVSFVILWYIVWQCVKKDHCLKKKISFVLCVVWLLLVMGIEWYSFSWNELSKGQNGPIEIANEYGSGNDCFYLWERSENSMVCYDEFCQYNKVYFWDKNTTVAEMNDVLSTYKHLVVYFNCGDYFNKEKQEEFLETMISQNANMSEYVLLFENSINCAYYLD